MLLGFSLLTEWNRINENITLDQETQASAWQGEWEFAGAGVRSGEFAGVKEDAHRTPPVSRWLPCPLSTPLVL